MFEGIQIFLAVAGAFFIVLFTYGFISEKCGKNKESVSEYAERLRQQSRQFEETCMAAEYRESQVRDLPLAEAWRFARQKIEDKDSARLLIINRLVVEVENLKFAKELEDAKNK